ncbi:MAG: acyl carrier protein [Clostridia bacterium]|nr:acyl carrier protein [Clostridia bacterium]
MILEKLIEIVSEQLDIDAATITADTNLIEDLGVDSLDIVEMFMEVQDEFDIEIPDEDVDSIKTIGDMADYIAKAK